jgi:lipopolysaccharide biosynthesis regulator YciM
LGALIDGDEDTAFRELKNAVQVDSSNVDAYLRLGDLFRKRGDAERALHLHRELATRGGLPKSVRSRVHEAICRDQLSLGRPARAVESAQEAVSLAEDPTTAMTTLLEAQEQKGDIEGAFRVKREILKREGRAKSGVRDLADYRASQGETLLAKGELKEAEKVLRDARKIDAGSHQARRTWGMLRERLGDYAGAIEAWEELLAEGPEAAWDVFRDLERVHFLNGTFSNMEATYNRFLDRAPGHEEATFGLARFLRRKGQIDDALDACRRGLDTHPGSRNLRVLHLALLLQSGRAAETEAILNDWLTGDLGEEQEKPDSTDESPLGETPS